MAEMGTRRGGRRKPVITIRPQRSDEGEPLGAVQLREYPHLFGGTTPNAERTWLQYVRDDLAMVHRTYYVALLDWQGTRVHHIETEYYEPEFPEARLWAQNWIRETDDEWHFVMWGQRYPNATAELRPAHGTMGRWLHPGNATAPIVDPATYILDSCGQFQSRCLRLWDTEGDSFAPLREFLIDPEGNCLYGRWWGREPAPAEDAVTMEYQDQRYCLRWEQIPNRLVRAIW